MKLFFGGFAVFFAFVCAVATGVRADETPLNRPEITVAGNVTYFAQNRMRLDTGMLLSVHRGTYIVPGGIIIRRGMRIRARGYYTAKSPILIANVIYVINALNVIPDPVPPR